MRRPRGFVAPLFATFAVHKNTSFFLPVKAIVFTSKLQLFTRLLIKLCSKFTLKVRNLMLIKPFVNKISSKLLMLFVPSPPYYFSIQIQITGYFNFDIFQRKATFLSSSSRYLEMCDTFLCNICFDII